jgi:hypothetical protein
MRYVRMPTLSLEYSVTISPASLISRKQYHRLLAGGYDRYSQSQLKRMKHSEDQTMKKVLSLCALVLLISVLPAGATTPTGENCSHPKIISALAYADSCSTCSFANSIEISCGGASGPGKDVVYKYVAPTDQRVSISLCGSSFNTFLYVFDETCTSGHVVACNNNSDHCGPGSTRSYIECLQLQANHTYYIVVDATAYDRAEGDSTGSDSTDADRCPCGNFKIHVTLCGEPPYSTVDMGDLPLCNYATLVNNPAHGLSGVAWLGANVTPEASPNYGNNDAGDDGVQYQPLFWTPCQQETVIVTVTAGPNYAAYADTGGLLYLNGWKDGNLDGDFCDEIPCVGAVASEWIVQDLLVRPGVHTISVIDPSVLDMGRYDGVFRWRLTSHPVGRYGFGLIDQAACPQMTCGTFDKDFLGEVEDYVLTDFQLAVEMGQLEAVPGDARITLRWNTLSELGNDHFEIVRDGRTIASIRSQGDSPSGHHYEYIDVSVDASTNYNYTLYGVGLDATRQQLATVSAMTLGPLAAATDYALYQNMPNPFNPITEITFDMPLAGHAALEVFNMAGQQVAVLANGLVQSGRHKVTFNASNLPTGMYIYRLQAGSFTASKKMLLIK